MTLRLSYALVLAAMLLSSVAEVAGWRTRFGAYYGPFGPTRHYFVLADNVSISDLQTGWHPSYQPGTAFNVLGVQFVKVHRDYSLPWHVRVSLFCTLAAPCGVASWLLHRRLRKRSSPPVPAQANRGDG